MYNPVYSAANIDLSLNATEVATRIKCCQQLGKNTRHENSGQLCSGDRVEQDGFRLKVVCRNCICPAHQLSLRVL